MSNNQPYPPLEPIKPPFFKRRKVLLIIVTLIVIIILVSIGWLIYWTYKVQKVAIGPEAGKELVAGPPPPGPQKISRPIDSPDTDGDGLFDLEEARFGTNPNLADTDQDGLNDFEEINMGTDPRNPDTDRDGFLDGDEIKRNFNPLGPGKLR
jgi:hypothetical protein